MRKNPQRLGGIVLAVACLVAPWSASAMSVNEYDSKPAAQRAEFLYNTIQKIISDVATVNPALSNAISDYFIVTPPGLPEPKGITAFEATLTSIENDSKGGKIDLNKAQIEDILTGIIQTNVLPNFTKKNNASAPKPTANP